MAFRFSDQIRSAFGADKSEHAVEKVYAELGSRHRVKRYQIKIIDVHEISAEDIENPILKKIVSEA